MIKSGSCTNMPTQDSWIEQKMKEFDELQVHICGYCKNGQIIDTICTNCKEQDIWSGRILLGEDGKPQTIPEAFMDKRKDIVKEVYKGFISQTLSDYKEQADDEILTQREEGINLGMNTMKDEVRRLIEGKKIRSTTQTLRDANLRDSHNAVLSELLNDDLLK